MVRIVIVPVVVAATLAAFTAGSSFAGNHEAVYTKGQAQLVEVMKIGGGSDEGDEPPAFYKPMAPCVGRDGTIYVLDYETTEISAFNARGEFLFKCARGGEGPGELRYPSDIEVDRFGRIVVAESGNKRFSLFSPRGKFIRTAPYFADDSGEFAYLPDGRLVAEIGRSYMINAGAIGTNWTLMVLDSTFRALAPLDSLKAEMIVVQTSKGMMMATPPFRNYLTWCVSPTGTIYHGKANQYRIAVLDDRLRPVRTISRDVPPVKITGEDRKKYNDQMAAEILSAAHFPDAKPPVAGLYCDNAGYLLVYRATAHAARTVTLDVYQPDGSFLGEVAVRGFRHGGVFDGDTILMRVSLEEELPALIRYRLE
jgi:hypothetical protein